MRLTPKQLLESRELRSEVDILAKVCSAALGSDMNVLFVLDGEGGCIGRIWTGCDPGSNVIDAKDLTVSVSQAGLSSDVVFIRREEKHGHGSLHTILDGCRMACGLTITLCLEGVTCVFLLATRMERQYGDKDMGLFRDIAQGLMSAAYVARLNSRNVRHEREAAVLSSISAEIAQIKELDVVLETIVKKTCDLLEAEISYIALASPEEQMIRVKTVHGARGDALKRLTHRFGEGVGGRVAATGTPLLINNWFEDIRPQPREASEILTEEGIISAICVPMRTRHDLVGVLYAASRREGAFNQEQLDLLESLGRQAAIAIENARLYDEQRKATIELQENVMIHTRFLELVLKNEGLTAIANTLSELVECPTIIENDRAQILCSSTRGCIDLGQDVTAALGVSSQEVLQQSNWRIYREKLEAREIASIPSRRAAGVVSHPRVIAPVAAGGDHLGFVSVLEVSKRLDVHNYAAVEQAAVVSALEFKRQEAARSNLLQQTLSAQENERMRIARELHDETSQAITALMVSLDTIKPALSISPTEAFKHVENARVIADGLLDGVHRVTADLRPTLLDDLGLIPAATWYGQTRLEPMGIKLVLRGNALDLRLPVVIETALFRILQEALTNVVRHANARTVVLSLSADESYVELEISDDGCGFDTHGQKSVDAVHPALGLWGMQERVNMLDGEFRLKSEPGKGTTITVRIPAHPAARGDNG
ncbi:MAG: GAF domain-containing sensor histidine kinase [Chloroflexota bacterium]